MKIIVDKFEYAKIIRECEQCKNTGYDVCSCALRAICTGTDDLEVCVTIRNNKPKNESYEKEVK